MCFEMGFRDPHRNRIRLRPCTLQALTGEVLGPYGTVTGAPVPVTVNRIYGH
jgi:hypothetical protein